LPFGVVKRSRAVRVKLAPWQASGASAAGAVSLDALARRRARARAASGRERRQAERGGRAGAALLFAGDEVPDAIVMLDSDGQHDRARIAAFVEASRDAESWWPSAGGAARCLPRWGSWR
jgi:hypothetical protein